MFDPEKIRSFASLDMETLMSVDLELLARYFASRDISQDEEMGPPVDPVPEPRKAAADRQCLQKTMRKKRL